MGEGVDSKTGMEGPLSNPRFAAVGNPIEAIARTLLGARRRLQKGVLPSRLVDATFLVLVSPIEEYSTEVGDVGR